MGIDCDNRLGEWTGEIDWGIDWRMTGGIDCENRLGE